MTTTAGTGAAARAVQVWKVYGAGETEVVALRDVSVELERGKFTAIMGPSGSGKSTLMHCLAGLDSVSRGEVFVGDTQVTGLNDAGLTRLRRDKIGFIFQQFNLLPTLTAEENILLPLSIAGRKPDPDWYRTVINTVHLGDRLSHRPSQLSGGQQQRVACARALVARPEVIFADEPTGNLDSRSGADVLTFLRDSVKTHGQTIVMVTHDPVAASYADRVLFLGDGAVVDEIIDPTADAVLDRMRTIDAPEDEGPRGAGPIPVSGGHVPESRGTTDPTGRTPHPGHTADDRADLSDPHRTEQEAGDDGGPGDPGSPSARERSRSAPAGAQTIQAVTTEGPTAPRAVTTAIQAVATEAETEGTLAEGSHAPATAARRKPSRSAGAGPAATRPPKGKPRKRSSPADGPQESPPPARNTEGADAAPNGSTGTGSTANLAASSGGPSAKAGTPEDNRRAQGEAAEGGAPPRTTKKTTGLSTRDGGAGAVRRQPPADV